MLIYGFKPETPAPNYIAKSRKPKGSGSGKPIPSSPTWTTDLVIRRTMQELRTSDMLYQPS